MHLLKSLVSRCQTGYRGSRFNAGRSASRRLPNALSLGLPGAYIGAWNLTMPPTVGRPDAWILTDKWTILVESKLGCRIDEDQLQCHADSAGWPLGSYDVCYLTWQEIYTVFSDKLAELGDRDPTHHLLVRQWLDYLGGQQMVPFVKLESDDFDYFNLSEDDQRPTMAQVHRRIKDFQQRLASTDSAKRILNRCGLPEDDNWKHSTPRAGEGSVWFNVGGEGAAEFGTLPFTSGPKSWTSGLLALATALTGRLTKAGDRNLSRTGAKMLQGFRFRRPVNRGRLRQGLVRESRFTLQGATDRPRGSAPHGHPGILAGSMGDKFAETFAVMLCALLLKKDRRYRTELFIQYSIPREQITKGDLSAQVQLVAHYSREDRRATPIPAGPWQGMTGAGRGAVVRKT